MASIQKTEIFTPDAQWHFVGIFFKNASMPPTLFAASDTYANNMLIDPIRLLALVGQVVKLATSAVKSGDRVIFTYLSSETTKYLGISTDLKSLQISLNLETENAGSQPVN